MDSPSFQPAPITKRLGESMDKWQFPQRKTSNAGQSDDSLLPRYQSSSTMSSPTPRKVNFFDVGGLLIDDHPSIASGSIMGRRDSYHSSVDPLSPHGMPSPTVPAASNGARRGSTALLQDLGGLLSPVTAKPPRRSSRNATELQPIPQSHQEYDSRSGGQPELVDVGGLLK
jgi:hypothetical protein